METKQTKSFNRRYEELRRFFNSNAKKMLLKKTNSDVCTIEAILKFDKIVEIFQKCLIINEKYTVEDLSRDYHEAFKCSSGFFNSNKL